MPATDALITKKDDGSIVIAVWNLVEPGATAAAKEFAIDVRAGGAKNATILRADAQHGDTLDAWKTMGSPQYPSREQIDQLRKTGAPAVAEVVSIKSGRLSLNVPPQGLAVITIPGNAAY